MPGGRLVERNIKIIVEYDGTAYAGWQIQKEQPTVQGKVVDAIKQVTGEVVSIIGAGRTDAGVHALGQTANFRITHHLEAGRFADAMNYYLPEDIRVHKSEEVPPEFNSRRDAVFRRYRYLISPRKSALYHHRRWEDDKELDYSLLQRAASMITGDHDFKPFCVAASQKEDNRCRIFHSRWYRFGDLLIYEIRGNRFLHNMVRSLVGGMANLARRSVDENPHNLTLSAFADILQSGNEERNIFTAPAQGLYLVSVGYGKDQPQ